MDKTEKLDQTASIPDSVLPNGTQPRPAKLLGGLDMQMLVTQGKNLALQRSSPRPWRLLIRPSGNAKLLLLLSGRETRLRNVFALYHGHINGRRRHEVWCL